MVWLIGKWTYDVNHLLVFNGGNKNIVLKIGNFCSIAHNCKIYFSENHHMEWVSTYPFGNCGRPEFNKFIEPYETKLFKDNIEIGNDVWIGGNVKILPGVKIGDGAVIGNSALVTKNVPPYAVVGGVPAKIIKYRFKPEQIEKLLKIKWWYWDDEKINDNLTLMCQPNIDLFIDAHIDDVIGDGEVSEEVKWKGSIKVN